MFSGYTTTSNIICKFLISMFHIADAIKVMKTKLTDNYVENLADLLNDIVFTAEQCCSPAEMQELLDALMSSNLPTGSKNLAINKYVSSAVKR